MFLSSTLRFPVLLFFLALFSWSCAHQKAARSLEETDPHVRIAQVCAWGSEIKEAKGMIQLKADSVDLNGQYPAALRVKEGNQLNMEITDPLGGTLAKINVDGDSYQIVYPRKNKKVSKNADHWSGIPLRWSSTLLLGRFPCPTVQEQRKAEILESTGDRVRFRIQGSKGNVQTYSFLVKERLLKDWPTELRWESEWPGRKSWVEFEFDRPEGDSGSPLQWKAKSDRGELKVRWESRSVTPIE